MTSRNTGIKIPDKEKDFSSVEFYKEKDCAIDIVLNKLGSNLESVPFIDINEGLQIDRCDIKLNLDNTDNVWEDLWKVFFKTISIKSRENKRCQMSFMPKKYWQNIIEMESIYEECN